MIFAIIDLLEKLLGWIKPFASKEKVQSDTNPAVQREQFSPQTSDTVSPSAPSSCSGVVPGRALGNEFSGLMEMQPKVWDLDDPSTAAETQDDAILADFRKYKSNPEMNRSPFAWGFIFERGSDRMILPKPKKAGLAVWYSLDLKWRGKYTIQWEVI